MATKRTNRTDITSVYSVVIITMAVALLLRTVSGDIFRSTERMKYLLDVEGKMLNNLEGFMNKEKFATVNDERKDKLQSFLTRLKEAHEPSLKDPNWAYNPINSFHLLKRFVDEWDVVIEMIMGEKKLSETETEFKEKVKEIKKERQWPSESDVKGSIIALIRLVLTYNLEILKLGQGQIGYVKCAPLTPSDLMTIGDYLYKEDKMYEAAVVYNGTLALLLEEGSEKYPGEDLLSVFQRLQSSYYRFGSTSLALKTVTDALVSFPGNKKLTETLDYYVKIIGEKDDVIFRHKEVSYFSLYGSGCHSQTDLCYYPIYVDFLKEELRHSPNSTRLKRQLDKYEKIVEKHRYEKTAVGRHGTKIMDVYEALCRGEMKVVLIDTNEARLSTLYCEYQTTSIPIFRGKKEYVNIDPDIVVFHGIINDFECEWIKKIGMEKMGASSIVGAGHTFQTDDTRRVSETAWLEEDEVLKKLTWKIEALTGLDIDYRPVNSYSELYQVLNYGLGGMYTPHKDNVVGIRNIEKKSPAHALSGDRIATFGFYLNDVEIGGATVFPILKTRVTVQKGSAAFWWNVKRNMDVDQRMLHAGCPVAVGSKWFVNKWIRQLGQTFARPCLLDSEL